MEIIIKQGRRKETMTLPNDLDIDYVVEAISNYAERENWDKKG